MALKSLLTISGFGWLGVAEIDLERLANSFGVPVAILVVIALGSWKASRYFAVKVIEPVVAAHVDFLNRMAKTQESQGQSLTVMAQSQKELTAAMVITTTAAEAAAKATAATAAAATIVAEAIVVAKALKEKTA